MKNQDAVNSAFAINLRQLLEENKETVRDLAALLGISPQAASQYQRGKAEPSIERIIKIAEHFSVTVDWLIGRSGAVKTLDRDIQAACRTLGISQEAAEGISRLSVFPVNTGKMSERIAFDLFMQDEYCPDLFEAIAKMYLYSEPETSEEREAREEVTNFLQSQYGQKYRIVSREEAFSAAKQEMIDCVSFISEEVSNYDGEIPASTQQGKIVISLYDKEES